MVLRRRTTGLVAAGFIAVASGPACMETLEPEPGEGSGALNQGDEGLSGDDADEASASAPSAGTGDDNGTDTGDEASASALSEGTGDDNATEATGDDGDDLSEA